MKRKMGGLLVIVLVLVPLQASANMQFAELGQETSLVCTYPGQTFGYWKNGEVLTGASEPYLEREAYTMRITGIDMYEGSAWFVSEWGEHGIEILNTLSSLTFLDVSPMGGIRIITVLPHLCPDRQAYCSVISEHLGQSGRVAPVQMFGFCEVK